MSPSSAADRQQVFEVFLFMARHRGPVSIVEACHIPPPPPLVLFGGPS